MKIEDLIAEKEFKNEIYEKKQLTYGNKAKTGRGTRAGYRGVKTEYDFLTREERKNLNSEVITTNLNDIVIKKEQFDLCSREKQKALLTHWRELYDNKYIMETMGVRGSNTFHKYIKDLEIPKKKRMNRTTPSTPRPRKAAAAITSVKTEKAPQIKLQFEEPAIQDQVIEKTIQQPIKSILQTVEGLQLEYNGIYDAEQLSKIFTKLQLLTDGEECKYHMNIKLTEKPI